VCARSAVAAAVAGGELVELVVPDLPQWSRELKVAYRREDAHQPQIRVLEEALEALRVSGGDPHPTVEAAR
jgi:DNA-binding transcriptional LysR family regulator